LVALRIAFTRLNGELAFIDKCLEDFAVLTSLECHTGVAQPSLNFAAVDSRLLSNELCDCYAERVGVSLGLSFLGCGFAGAGAG
jgi:hypothetical protein